jgi:hypothetical protein
MSTFKKAKVVMLPTNQKTNGMICKDITEQDKIIAIKTKHLMEHEDYIGHHLYIILDKKPDNGDYYIIDGISEVLKNNGLKFIDDNCKKIIATTDTSLQWLDESEINPELARPNGLWKCLPQPPQQFIQKYIEEYNRGNIITDVLVEYQTDFKSETKLYMLSIGDNPDDFEYGEPTVKINPKDNNITIKKVKDNWNREEIRILKNKLISLSKEEQMKILNTVESFDKWIEENL